MTSNVKREGVLRGGGYCSHHCKCQRDRPRGRQARPAPRVVYPVARPESPRDAEAGGTDRGAGERTTSPRVASQTPRCARAGGVNREACKRVLFPASYPLRRAPNPARQGSQRDRHRGRQAHHIPPRRAAEPSAARAPASRVVSQTQRCAHAGGVNREACERVLFPTSCPLCRALNLRVTRKPAR